VDGRQLLYLAYLLRLWQVNGHAPGWRASLQSVHGGWRQGFSNLEELFDYLQELCAAETGEE
jgi:hypothetical protein